MKRIFLSLLTTTVLFSSTVYSVDTLFTERLDVTLTTDVTDIVVDRFQWSTSIDFVVAGTLPKAIYSVYEVQHQKWEVTAIYQEDHWYSTSVSEANLNDDPYPDLIVTNSDPLFQRVTIMFGGGYTGIFQIDLSYAAGVCPIATVPVDVDNDGDIDIAVANQANDWGNSMSILRNDGTGRFGYPEQYDAYPEARMVVAGDLNGDEFPDLVLICSPLGEKRMYVYLNNGDGSFGTPVYFALGEDSSVPIAALGDIDHDGDLDIFAAQPSTPELWQFRNDGNGSFTPAEITELDILPHSLLIEDLNLDGWTDLVLGGGLVGQNANAIAYFQNDKEGFVETPLYHSLPVGIPSKILTFDMDNDSDLDLVCSNRHETVSILYNQLFPHYDSDSDGVLNPVDNCPEQSNYWQSDYDQDGVGDACDNCLTVANQDQADLNGNLIGDACEDCCGFWTGGFTGNTDCSPDGKRNLADITRLIDRVYMTKEKLCCDENGNVDGDLDGKMGLADITVLIDHVYISHYETAPCQ